MRRINSVIVRISRVILSKLTRKVVQCQQHLILTLSPKKFDRSTLGDSRWPLSAQSCGGVLPYCWLSDFCYRQYVVTPFDHQLKPLLKVVSSVVSSLNARSGLVRYHHLRGFSAHLLPRLNVFCF